MGLDSGEAFGVHLAVEGEGFATGRGQSGATSAFGAAADGFDQRLAKALVHGADEGPGAHIRHVQAGCGFGDGAGFFECGKEFGFAGAKGDVFSIFNSQARADGRFVFFVLCH